MKIGRFKKCLVDMKYNIRVWLDTAGRKECRVNISNSAMVDDDNTTKVENIDQVAGLGRKDEFILENRVSEEHPGGDGGDV